MKKLLQVVILFTFSFSYILSPLLSVNAQTTANIVSAQLPALQNYGINILSTGTSTWQKSVDQKISFDYLNTQLGKVIDSSIYALAIFNNSSGQANLSNPPINVKVAVYLVPVIQTIPPVKPNPLQIDAMKSYLNTGPQNFLNGTLSDPLGPSSLLYSHPQKYGYFIGYINKSINDPDLVTKTDASGRKTVTSSSTKTNLIPSINYAWIPNGDYYVYLAVGTQSVTFDPSTIKNNNGDINLYLSAITNSTPKDRAFQIYLPRTSAKANRNEPLYSSDYLALPESTSTIATTMDVVGLHKNDIKRVNVKNTTWYNVVYARSTAPISVIAAPDPSLLITSPFGDNNVWNKGSQHDVKWLTNFKRSNDNNTGIVAFNGISIVPPYGYGIDFNHGGVTDPYNSAAGIVGRYAISFIPVIGQIIGPILSILDLFGVFNDSEEAFAVKADVQAVPYNNGVIGTNSYRLGGSYIELGKSSVNVDNLPVGNYLMVVSASWTGGKTRIIGTSTPVSILPRAPSISNVNVVSTSTTGAQITVTGNNFTAANNTLFIDSSNTITGLSSQAVSNGSRDNSYITANVPLSLINDGVRHKFVISNENGTSTSFTASLTSVVRNTSQNNTDKVNGNPVINHNPNEGINKSRTSVTQTNSATQQNNPTQTQQVQTQASTQTTSSETTPPASTTNLPASTDSSASTQTNTDTSGTAPVVAPANSNSTGVISATVKYLCPYGYVLAPGGNNSCVRQGETSQNNNFAKPTKGIPPTIQYSCPKDYTLNSSAHTCTPKHSSQSQDSASSTANAWDAIVNWFGSIFGK